MWRLFNKLFGTHYIEYRDTATSFVARAYKTPKGDWRMAGGWCRAHYDSNLKPDGTLVRGGRWTDLTGFSKDIRE